MIRGDIYMIDLSSQPGSVQKGLRPVVIVQNNIGNHFSPTTIVCCITSKKRNKSYLPTHCFIGTNGGLIRNSTVLCEQIFTVNKSDLKFYIGTITNQGILSRLDKCVGMSLGLIKE